MFQGVVQAPLGPCDPCAHTRDSPPVGLHTGRISRPRAVGLRGRTALPL